MGDYEPKSVLKLIQAFEQGNSGSLSPLDFHIYAHFYNFSELGKLESPIQHMKGEQVDADKNLFESENITQDIALTIKSHLQQLSEVDQPAFTTADLDDGKMGIKQWLIWKKLINDNVHTYGLWTAGEKYVTSEGAVWPTEKQLKNLVATYNVAFKGKITGAFKHIAGQEAIVFNVVLNTTNDQPGTAVVWAQYLKTVLGNADYWILLYKSIASYGLSVETLATNLNAIYEEFKKLTGNEIKIIINGDHIVLNVIGNNSPEIAPPQLPSIPTDKWNPIPQGDIVVKEEKKVESNKPSSPGLTMSKTAYIVDSLSGSSKKYVLVQVQPSKPGLIHLQIKCSPNVKPASGLEHELQRPWGYAPSFHSQISQEIHMYIINEVPELQVVSLNGSNNYPSYFLAQVRPIGNGSALWQIATPNYPGRNRSYGIQITEPIPSDTWHLLNHMIMVMTKGKQ